MKTVPLTLTAGAVLGSFVLALATQKQSVCEIQQQYIRIGTAYYTAATDYVCLQTAPTNPCTYYLSNMSPVTYTICQWGDYYDLSGGITAALHKKKWKH